MRQKYKIKGLPKKLPFYTSKIKKFKKNKNIFTNNRFLSELPFFPKKVKNLTNYQLSRELPFFPKRSKRPKRLTKNQILRNILPFYDRVGISKKERAFRYYAETYNVEVTDTKSLSESLFLAKSSTIDLFSDLLEGKRGFKYVLSATITLNRWNNVINRYDVETIYINSEVVIVTNQRFGLGTSYEKLRYILYILNIWSGEGSGWIVDKIEAIHIKISNYNPSSGSSYIPLSLELNHLMKGLVHLKKKDIECFKWCHVRFINPQNKDPDRIKKTDKRIASTLDYIGINFTMKARDYEVVEERFNINVNVFGYQNKVFPLFVSKKSNN